MFSVELFVKRQKIFFRHLLQTKFVLCKLQLLILRILSENA